ncbi:serine hydrolase domain-containing protein [Oceanirhabdus seepicola]|uniref:Beta-lactamase family protein n=1 Tax=Oceanirhabdus seepicola TaxID=2828781 RepID=A0A9J6P6P5_9CLOT|nr:serine hydrolase domain-containing protein [Oceanirhabdus seepicola]MCM1991176.1 beta-lactamase family protein [Oceanirhabdus seepicola]
MEEKIGENIKKLEIIRENIKTYINEAGEKFNGSLLVSVNDEKLISKGYGYANFELDVKNTEKTKFRICSITKQFTAVALMQLVEKGLVSVEDTLNKYIADYPQGNKITIHHLLTHTSGIVNHSWTENYAKMKVKKYTIEELIETFKYLPLNFEPGSKFEYSNSGYMILSYIIEKVSNKMYGEYIQECIFDKLSMNESGDDSPLKILKNRASGYCIDEVSKEFRNSSYIDMSIIQGDGGLYSTVEDLHIWNKELFDGSIISKESLKKITTPYVAEDDSNSYGYGLSLGLEEIAGKVRNIIYHGGEINGFLCTNEVFIEENVQIIALSNIMNHFIFELVENIEEIILKELN